MTAFRKYAKANTWEVDITNLVVQCDCSYKDVLFACQEFNAVLLNAREEVTTEAISWEPRFGKLFGTAFSGLVR